METSCSNQNFPYFSHFPLYISTLLAWPESYGTRTTFYHTVLHKTESVEYSWYWQMNITEWTAGTQVLIEWDLNRSADNITQTFRNQNCPPVVTSTSILCLVLHVLGQYLIMFYAFSVADLGVYVWHMHVPFWEDQHLHSSSKETQLFLFHFPWWPWVRVSNSGSWTFTTWPLIYNLLQKMQLSKVPFLLRKSVHVPCTCKTVLFPGLNI